MLCHLKSSRSILKVSKQKPEYISRQILVLNLVTIHNILWLNFRFLNFRPAPAMVRSECAQKKTSWSCHGWLNTQSVPYWFDYPAKQWEKQTDGQRERQRDRPTDWAEFCTNPRFGTALFCFFSWVFHSVPFVKNDKYAEIYFSNADGGCVT